MSRSTATAARTASRDLAVDRRDADQRFADGVEAHRRRPPRRRCRARRRVQRPSASSATCAAAATSAKSLRRALTSWKPAPTRAFVPDRKADRRRCSRRACIAVIIGPDEEIIAPRRVRCAATRCAARCCRRASPAPAGSRPPDRRSRPSRRPCRGCASALADQRQRLASSGTLRGDRVMVQRGDLPRRRADATAVAVVADAVQLGDARDVDQPRGRASRIAIMGTSVCPPAMIAASSSAASSRRPLRSSALSHSRKGPPSCTLPSGCWTDTIAAAAPRDPPPCRQPGMTFERHTVMSVNHQRTVACAC